MARRDEKTVVVAKRGCTCCGTGCALVGLVIPGVMFVLWSTAGGVVAISALAAAMLARGAQVAVTRRRAVTRAAEPPCRDD